MLDKLDSGLACLLVNCGYQCAIYKKNCHYSIVVVDYLLVSQPLLDHMKIETKLTDEI